MLKSPRNPILPAPLRPGDLIGIIHPAGPVRNAAIFEQGLRILRDLGLRIRHYPPEGNGAEYLAAGDRYRLREFHRIWADDEVKALIAARGGYGCLRIMRGMDADFLRLRPKRLIGFSDLTVLLNGIFGETGTVTLHGPMITALPRIDRLSLQHFKEVLSNRFPPLLPASDLAILRPGIGQGRLTGGNLTTLTHLIGTPWQPEFTGNILFIEDTAEPPYKLDRILTHLSCCGLLDNLAGLILGVFDPSHDDRLEILRLNEQVWKRVLELTDSSVYPVWGGFPIGHRQTNFPLPVGMEAIMDSTTGTLRFLPHTCERL